jgi:RNA polymerase sigma factor (sigma-70 family)
MTELDDHELLADYVRSASEAAFAALVARYVNLVHSAALRFTGNPHHAEEITQAVFIILARKAGSLPRSVVVSGWLYQSARLTAANFVKGEIRRQNREQEAYMQSTLNEPEAKAWRQIGPLLEEAMGSLGETDRNAVVLRFFENKSAREVAATLKLKEEAAHKRVHRAVEKLRRFFTKRGIALSGAAIAGAVSANSVQAAPAGLAAAAATAAVKGTLLSATITTLVKGTMKTMTWMKLKFAVGMGTAVLLVGGAATMVISQTSTDGQPMTPARPLEIIKKSQAAYAALDSYSDSGSSQSEVGGASTTITFNLRLQRPNLYRVEWTEASAFFTSRGVAWSAGNGDYLLMQHGQNNVQPARYPNMEEALSSATGVSGQASAILPGTFFQQTWGDVLKTPVSGKTRFTQQEDEVIAGVDCYVVSSSRDPADLPNQGKLPGNMGKIGKKTTTLWIGKQDYLIHQTQTHLEGTSIKMPEFSDSQIKGMLKESNTPATPEAIAARRKLLDAASQQAQSLMTSGKFTFTQTHENIVVNKKFSPADFAREINPK